MTGSGGVRRAGALNNENHSSRTQRFKPLQQLKSCGINDFDVWSLDDVRMPDRSPVFLRTASAHRGVLTGLL